MGNVRVHLSAVTRDSLRQLAQIASRISKISVRLLEDFASKKGKSAKIVLDYAN